MQDVGTLDRKDSTPQIYCRCSKCDCHNRTQMKYFKIWRKIKKMNIHHHYHSCKIHQKIQLLPVNRLEKNTEKPLLVEYLPPTITIVHSTVEPQYNALGYNVYSVTTYCNRKVPCDDELSRGTKQTMPDKNVAMQYLELCTFLQIESA